MKRLLPAFMFLAAASAEAVSFLGTTLCSTSTTEPCAAGTPASTRTTNPDYLVNAHSVVHPETFVETGDLTPPGAANSGRSRSSAARRFAVRFHFVVPARPTLQGARGSATSRLPRFRVDGPRARHRLQGSRSCTSDPVQNFPEQARMPGALRLSAGKTNSQPTPYWELPVAERDRTAGH